MCFLAGIQYERASLLTFGPVKLTAPLKLQHSTESIGTLPKGSILYSYSSGDTETFVVFVNTKALNLLEPVEFEHFMTVSPLDAYVQ